MAAELRPGETVYLVPTLPTAPTAAYRQPQVVVKSAFITGPRVVVILPDGKEIETDKRNLVRKLPEPQQTTPKPRPAMPDGYEEIHLF